MLANSLNIGIFLDRGHSAIETSDSRRSIPMSGTVDVAVVDTPPAHPCVTRAPLGLTNKRWVTRHPVRRTASARMRRERVLVGLSAPAGAIGYDQMPRLDLRRVRHQLVVPGEAIDVDLHDAQVGHRGGKMRVHHGAQ